MGIVADANVPNIILQLVLADHQIVFRGIVKVVPDNYWQDEVVPKLYPLWDRYSRAICLVLLLDVVAHLTEEHG